jgi:dTMP kinase
MRGRFITYEGGEGVGKSTQIRLLATSLTAIGIETVLTREPGGSPYAEKLREVLLSGAAKPFGAFAETILFNTARDNHLEVTIRPALARGAWVLCDRFIDSTRAYQGVMGEIEPALIRSLERVVVGETVPDLTLILDMPARDGLARAKNRSNGFDRFEAESLAFHRKLREAFLAIAEHEPRRCAVIEASGPMDDVARAIFRVVRHRLLLNYIPAPA